MIDAATLERVRDEAFARRDAGDWAGAETLFAELIERGADDPVLSMHRAICLVELGRPAQALEVTEACRPYRPVWWRALGIRADALTALQRGDEAAECRAEHVAMKESVSGLVLLASERNRQKRVDEAISLLRRAVELEPDFDESNRLLGSYLHDEGRHEEAVPYFERALALDDDPAMRRTLRAHLQRARVGLNADQWEDTYDRAEGLADEGKLAEARPLYERLLMAHPYDAWAWSDYAECLLDLGEAELAIAALDWCRQNAHVWVEALRLLDEIHEARGDDGRVEELRREGVALRETLREEADEPEA